MEGGQTKMNVKPEFTFHLCALHGKNYQPVLAVPTNRTNPNSRGREYTHRDWKKDSDAELKKRSEGWVKNFTPFVNACLHRNAKDSLWYFYHIFLYLPEEATIGSFLNLTGPMEKAFGIVKCANDFEILDEKIIDKEFDGFCYFRVPDTDCDLLSKKPVDLLRMALQGRETVPVGPRDEVGRNYCTILFDETISKGKALETIKLAIRFIHEESFKVRWSQAIGTNPRLREAVSERVDNFKENKPNPKYQELLRRYASAQREQDRRELQDFFMGLPLKRKSERIEYIYWHAPFLQQAQMGELVGASAAEMSRALKNVKDTLNQLRINKATAARLSRATAAN
jgi:hypothetical protein